jgi:hypothetical protein
MATSSTYYGTQAIAARTGITKATVLRFLWATKGKNKCRQWYHFDEPEFEALCAQIQVLQAMQPHHPLRALRARCKTI